MDMVWLVRLYPAEYIYPGSDWFIRYRPSGGSTLSFMVVA